MGLFNFIGNVGKKIFGDSDDDMEKRNAIHKEIDSHGLPAHLSVDVEGNKVKIAGNVTDQATKEKIILAAGNIEGVSEIEENIVVADQENAHEARFVTVQKGDTLWKIATEAYGDGSKFNIIFEANKPMLESADAIYPGQSLRIPSLEVA